MTRPTVRDLCDPAYTPGPWIADDLAVKWHHDRGAVIARTVWPEDAQLIAQAPELLAGAEEFLAWFRGFMGSAAMLEIKCDQLDRLQAAIDAARGNV